VARRQLRLALALALLALPARAWADEVFLKDGTRLEGTVLDPPEAQGPTLRLETTHRGNPIVRELDREQVRWIRRIRGEDAQRSRDAQAALERGEMARAIALLELLAAARPEDPVAHRELGFARLLDNHHAEALAPLQRATTLDPTDFEAQLLLAQLLERLERVDEAIEAYQQAAFTGMRHVVAWRSLARLLMTRGHAGDREQALKVLALAATESPRDEALALDRADILLETGDEADARRARDVLEELLQREPHAPVVTSRLASLEAAAGQHAAARDRLAALLAALRKDDPQRAWLQAEWALYAWLAADPRPAAPPGTDVGQEGVHAEPAAALLDMIIELRPDDGPLLLARARIDLQRELPEVARVWLEAAALAGPPAVTTDALLLQEVAASLLRAELPEAPPLRTFFGPAVSRRKAARLVELVPWLAAAHETLARVLERDGAYAEAAQAYQAARARTTDPAEQARLEAAAQQAQAERERRERNQDM